MDAAKAALEAAKQAQYEMEKNYESTKAANAKSDAAISLQLRGISDQIEEAKKKVARLSGEADSQIVAEVPGIVNSIFFTAGNTPPAGEKVASLNVSDAGYTLTFNVTAEQAKRLHVGDEASVTNFYWGSSVTAKLTSIKNDPKDPQNTRILSFDLEGDVTPGAELTLAVGSRSMSYDHVVPKNAVRKDNNGTFVLVVKSENTALGNKYTASRMDVTVLAEDDTLAAITGDFEWSAYVITQSSDGTQIKNGDRVRLADS
ncbi:MAG: HlyD family efflux transporter periplasmic adaptor subunit [Oscillospiraceae bacterium]|nr:HlyD family efflux transporter periplasmic adaptor subunit [Oscillospiraceae bacterium]